MGRVATQEFVAREGIRQERTTVKTKAARKNRFPGTAEGRKPLRAECGHGGV